MQQGHASFVFNPCSETLDMLTRITKTIDQASRSRKQGCGSPALFLAHFHPAHSHLSTPWCLHGLEDTQTLCHPRQYQILGQQILPHGKRSLNTWNEPCKNLTKHKAVVLCSSNIASGTGGCYMVLICCHFLFFLPNLIFPLPLSKTMLQFPTVCELPPSSPCSPTHGATSPVTWPPKGNLCCPPDYKGTIAIKTPSCEGIIVIFYT